MKNEADKKRGVFLSCLSQLVRGVPKPIYEHTSKAGAPVTESNVK